MQELVEAQETPTSTLLPFAGPFSGLGTIDQLVPSHDSTRVLVALLIPFPVSPTAVQDLAEAQETLLSSSPPDAGPGLGLGTIDQRPPSQNSTSVLETTLPELPTAVQKPRDGHETPLSAAPGLATTDHRLPSHEEEAAPTAMQKDADVHEMPPRLPPLGLGTTDQPIAPAAPAGIELPISTSSTSRPAIAALPTRPAATMGDLAWPGVPLDTTSGSFVVGQQVGGAPANEPTVTICTIALLLPASSPLETVPLG
jgi:hypothetical protein